MDGVTAYKELHCDYKSFKYSYFPNIYFNFNGYEIKLTPEEIFYYNNNNKFYRLLLVLTNKKDYWIFGSLLTNKNNMIFDGDNGTVTFYKMRKLFNSSIIINYMITSLIFLCVIGIYYSMKIYYINLRLKINDNENDSVKVNLIN